MNVPVGYESYFRPVMLTDAAGNVGDEIAEDVEASRPRAAAVGLTQAAGD